MLQRIRRNRNKDSNSDHTINTSTVIGEQRSFTTNRNPISSSTFSNNSNNQGTKKKKKLVNRKSGAKSNDRGNINVKSANSREMIGIIDRSVQETSELVNFDVCVEACDMLAADRDDSRTSVHVSPDGELLDIAHHSASQSNVRSDTADDLKSQSQTQSHSQYSSWSSVLPTSDNNEQYDAIMMGKDVGGSDREANGFSAKGWNPDRASVALRKAQSTLQATTRFVEELIIGHKANAAALGNASCHLSVSVNETVDDSSPLDKDGVDTTLNGNNSNSISISDSDMNPLLFPPSTLHKAILSIEKYHMNLAHSEAFRWRYASKIETCNSNASPIKEARGGLLSNLQMAEINTCKRATKREKALNDAQARAEQAERIVSSLRDIARRKWDQVNSAESIIQTKIEEETRHRAWNREQQRRKIQHQSQEKIPTSKRLASTVTQQEIWNMVSQFNDEAEEGMSFKPTGLPSVGLEGDYAMGPTDLRLESTALGRNVSADSDDDNCHFSIESCIKNENDTNLIESSLVESRLKIEDEIGFNQLRIAAVEADEDVEDAAAMLLNVLSSLDTTKRSARIAAEGCLLSAANSQANFLKSLVQEEKKALEERMRSLELLETDVIGIDVRADLDMFIEHEKREIPYGATRLGEDDDGGIASAIAVLNCHSEGIGVGISISETAEMSAFSGWGEEGDENDTIHRDDLEKAVDVIFQVNISFSMKEEGIDTSEEVDTWEKSIHHLDSNVKFLVETLREKSMKARGFRASTCYALNNQRGIHTVIRSRRQFDGLCSILDAILTGCDRESADIANAKMCMMLAQTFYILEGEDKVIDMDNINRAKRIFPKNYLIHHLIWKDEDFWVQALFQCVTESLTTSGVMANFDVATNNKMKGKVATRKMKWYDLNSDERSEAASQVHAVIFAQLGALAHSMIEFQCDLDQACAFVRRLSIRHQLPLSQRTMLLEHLIKHYNQEHIHYDTSTTD